MMIAKKIFFNTVFVYFTFIVLGIFSGTCHSQIVHTLGSTLAEIFMNIFKCISTPIIALSLIVTLSTFDEKNISHQVWKKTLLYTISTTIIAAAVSCLLYVIISPANVSVNVSSDASTNFQNHHVSYLGHLAKIVPDNLLGPFINHDVLSVLLMGLLIGVAIRYIPDDQLKENVRLFFRSMQSLFFVITRWIVMILPLGIYGFITVTVTEIHRSGSNLTGIGEYLFIIILANLIQGFIILPMWLRRHHIQPLKTLKRMLPALTLAFFSKSSAGTLPITIATAEKNLNLHPKISRFVLPLCTSINMNGCAAFIFTTVIYLLQNNGELITFPLLISWIIISTVAAIGNAGVPMGCFLLSASLLSSMNVPITLLGLILPFYNLIDMVETALNVWSDSCVATVVNQHFAKKLPEEISETRPNTLVSFAE